MPRLAGLALCCRRGARRMSRRPTTTQAPGAGARTTPAIDRAQGGAAGAARVPERRLNPFIHTFTGGRVLSALMLPWFLLRPPEGFGVLATTGRRTGKTRRRCVRAVRENESVYIVCIGGALAAWVKNIEANPRVHLRIRDGSFTGHARRPAGSAEHGQARQAYCETVNRFDYRECHMHRSGRPTAARIKELHRGWFDTGLPLVVELEDR